MFGKIEEISGVLGTEEVVSVWGDKDLLYESHSHNCITNFYLCIHHLYCFVVSNQDTFGCS